MLFWQDKTLQPRITTITEDVYFMKHDSTLRKSPTTKIQTKHTDGLIWSTGNGLKLKHRLEGQTHFFVLLLLFNAISYKPLYSSFRETVYLQHSEHGVELVLAQGDVVGDLTQDVDRLQPHLLNLIIEHVHQEIQALLCKR